MAYRQINRSYRRRGRALVRFLCLTITVDLSHDHHQRQSYGHWSKHAGMTRITRSALLDMNLNALSLLNTVLLMDNVNDERCVSVNKLTHCIKNPFRSDCEESLPQHHELVLANRIAFCRKAENVDNALCTYSYAYPIYLHETPVFSAMLCR